MYMSFLLFLNTFNFLAFYFSHKHLTCSMFIDNSLLFVFAKPHQYYSYIQVSYLRPKETISS